ncbi:MAG: hypothetical protein NTY15_10855 [Planctomycetota bacterium]|nr:hypothetical protein [Planctomycetota bacterium]
MKSRSEDTSYLDAPPAAFYLNPEYPTSQAKRVKRLSQSLGGHFRVIFSRSAMKRIAVCNWFRLWFCSAETIEDNRFTLVSNPNNVVNNSA